MNPDSWIPIPDSYLVRPRSIDILVVNSVGAEGLMDSTMTLTTTRKPSQRRSRVFLNRKQRTNGKIDVNRVGLKSSGPAEQSRVIVLMREKEAEALRDETSFDGLSRSPVRW